MDEAKKSSAASAEAKSEAEGALAATSEDLAGDKAALEELKKEGIQISENQEDCQVSMGIAHGHCPWVGWGSMVLRRLRLTVRLQRVLCPKFVGALSEVCPKLASDLSEVCPKLGGALSEIQSVLKTNA